MKENHLRVMAVIVGLLALCLNTAALILLAVGSSTSYLFMIIGGTFTLVMGIILIFLRSRKR